MMQSHMVFEEDLSTVIKEALDPVFGNMTSKKAVMAEAGLVPDWKIRRSMHNFLKGQTDIRKRQKGRTSKRYRDVEQEKFRRIVDGRTG